MAKPSDYQHSHKECYHTTEAFRDAWRARRIPLVLAYNGYVPSGPYSGLVMSDGIKDHPLNFGTLNYWVLREWASHCLGQDTREVGICPLGEKFAFVQALDPEGEHSLPSIHVCHRHTEQYPGYVGEVYMDGEVMDWETYQKRTGTLYPVQWSGYSFYLDDVGGSLQRVMVDHTVQYPTPSAYGMFASRALISGSGGDFSLGGVFPKVHVPTRPLDTGRDMGKVVYRKSPFSGDAAVLQELTENGYGFLVDKEEGFIYYSNSVAVAKGYPPVASALGWHKVPLRPLPSDWMVQLDQGQMAIGIA